MVSLIGHTTDNGLSKVKLAIYIAALCDPDRCRAALQYSPCSLDPMPAATLRRISMKAPARYQVILLGEQRHIRCEQLAQGCCPNSAAVGVEPATSRSPSALTTTRTEPPNEI